MLIFWGLYHLKLFTQPDKSQIEKKVQELERSSRLYKKNSVRAILFLCLFVCFHINRSNRINTKALECIVMPLKTRLEVIIFWNQQWFTEKKKTSQRCFLWSSIKILRIKERRSGNIDQNLNFVARVEKSLSFVFCS